MRELIEALQIFLDYEDIKYPTHCEHDELSIHGYHKDKMSEADVNRLSELGFNWDEEMKRFYSTKYGSC